MKKKRRARLATGRAYPNLSAASDERYRRVLDAIALKRRNPTMSLSQAAKMSGTTLDSVRRYAASALETGSRDVMPSDRLPRPPMLMLTSEGLVSVVPANSIIASRIARHANAIRQYLTTGDAKPLIRFEGKAIRSEGEAYEFLTDTRTINRLARAGAIYFLDIYDSGGRIMDDYSREIRRQTRITNKLLRLKTDQPFCIYCGMTDCRCLLRPDDNSMLRCRNCAARRVEWTPEALAQRLGRFRSARYWNPACVVCGEEDLRSLDLDHLAGAANSALVEPLCLNCHAIKSDDAEDEPMASLRLGDPARSALALQAAFDIGLAAVLGLYGLAAGNEEGGAARAAFFALVALALIAWAIWNLSADEYLTQTLGPGYDKAIPAEVPQ